MLTAELGRTQQPLKSPLAEKNDSFMQTLLKRDNLTVLQLRLVPYSLWTYEEAGAL